MSFETLGFIIALLLIAFIVGLCCIDDPDRNYYWDEWVDKYGTTRTAD